MTFVRTESNAPLTFNVISLNINASKRIYQHYSELYMNVNDAIILLR